MSTLAAEPVSNPSEIASLHGLIRCVAEAVARPAERAEIDRLRLSAIEAIAQFPVAGKDPAAVAAACQLVEAVLTAGWNDAPAAAEVVAEAGRVCAQGWTGLLAGLLLAPAWQMKFLPAFEAAPLFLWPTLALAYFRLPASLTALGQSEALAVHQLTRLRELARLAKQNSGSSALRQAAEIALGGCDRRLMAAAPAALAENLILRGWLHTALRRRTDALAPLALSRADRRLRIGVILPALINSRQSRLILPWFEALDPLRFEAVVCFAGESDGWGESRLSDRGVSFRRLSGEPSIQNEQLQSAGFDVALFAVDAAGPSRALAELASPRVAPLQLALDEFEFTCGLTGIDAAFRRSAAPGTIPASERWLVLSCGGLPLYPANWLGQARQSWDRPGLGLGEASVVFSSAAPFALLSPEWADEAVQLLRDLPDSRLLIHSGAPEDSGASGLTRLCAIIEPALARYDIGADRLMISNEPLDCLAEVGALLRLADVHLDSFPLSDGEGCNLARGAGVPVLAVNEARRRAATADSRQELRAGLARQLASPAAYFDPLAFAESVGVMLEQAFDLAAQDESGAAFRAQPPLEMKRSVIAPGMLEEAALLLEAGLAAEALPRIAPWFAAAPLDSEVRSLYYSALIQGGQPRRALIGLTAALERQVAEAETWRLIARARLFLGESEEAVAALRTCLQYDAKDPATWAVLDEIATVGGHFELSDEIARARTALAPAAPAAVPESRNRSLYFSPVGRHGKGFLTRLVERFPAEQFDFLVIAYDETDFSELAGRVEVIRDRGQKWRLIKKYLTPEKVAGYDYVFMWDDDLDPQNFDPVEFIDILRRNRIDVAQPSLSADSFSFHPITVAHPGPVGRLTNFVEIMCPVYSSRIWPSIYPYIDPEINELGWGYDLIPLGRKAIIDCMSVRHTRPGQSSNLGAADQSAAWCQLHQISRPKLLNLWSLT